VIDVPFCLDNNEEMYLPNPTIKYNSFYEYLVDNNIDGKKVKSIKIEVEK